MIIKLRNADFSSNNIGRIQLNREVTPETEAILANYSRTLTNTQKLAVQDFIAELKTEGLWSKIDNLYIPALAGAVSEAFYNIKTETSDFTPTSTYYEMSGYGVRPVSGSSAVDSSNIAKATLGGSGMDSHFMVYVNTITTDSGTWFYPFCCASSDTYVGMSIQQNTGANVWSLAEYGNPSVGVQNVPTTEDITGFWAISSGQEKIIGRLNNIVEGNLNNVAAADTTFTGMKINIGYQYASKPYMSVGMKILSTGRYLTASQLETFNTLCDTFDEVICT